MYDASITQRDWDALIEGHRVLHDGADFAFTCCSPTKHDPPLSLHRHTLEETIIATDHLASLWDAGEGKWVRPLTRQEQDFIDNEMQVCAIDFRYWAERYAWVELDTVKGGIGRLRLWGSQALLVNEIGRIERDNWDLYDSQVAAGYDEDLIRVPGICVILHKARQLGATTIAQCLLMHRAIFSRNLFCLIATVDEDKMVKLFEKTERIYNHLPHWMRPQVKSKTKTEGYKFGELDVEVARQEGTQKGGMGQGSTPSVVHLTEVSAWPDPVENLQNHLFKAIPWSLRTLIILESTAQGGEGTWWQQFFNNTRSAKKSSTRWRSIFVPWYAEKGKYRLPPPAGWEPKQDTMRYAKRVFETSAEFIKDENGNGVAVMLDRDQLYWYEVSKAEAIRDGVLNLFFINYPATPEESFRASNVSPFKAEVLDRLSLSISKPRIIAEWDYLKNKIVKADLSNFTEEDEPRGLIYIYKKPEQHRRYVVGVDNARGIVNWNRNTRTDDDLKKDNGALVVMKVGERGEPDEVVATFFAPITPEDLAPIGNFLGRMYAGIDEECCMQVIETWPSPGTTYQDRLITEFGYWNLYRKANINTGNWARDCGWEATNRAVVDLWVRTKRHIAFCERDQTTGAIRRIKFVTPSKHMISEMETCAEDPKVMTAKAEWGYHDDILRAGQLCIWGAHDWTSQGTQQESQAREATTPKPDFQRSDMTVGEMNDAVNRMLQDDFDN